MDAATIAAKVYRGYAIAASKIGPSFNQFRPGGPNNPTGGSPIASLPASFAPGKSYSKYTASGDHDAALWTVLVDGSQTQVGDYLVGTSGTFFIAAMQPLLPILAVKCTRTINVLRTNSAAAAGINGYGGDVQGGETSLLTGWPAWSSHGKQGTRGGTEGHLPGDVGERAFEFLIPPVPAQLHVSDIITDDQNFRYVILLFEQSDLGIRINATQMVT